MLIIFCQKVSTFAKFHEICQDETCSNFLKTPKSNKFQLKFDKYDKFHRKYQRFARFSEKGYTFAFLSREGYYLWRLYLYPLSPARHLRTGIHTGWAAEHQPACLRFEKCMQKLGRQVGEGHTLVLFSKSRTVSFFPLSPLAGPRRHGCSGRIVSVGHSAHNWEVRLD